MYLTLRGRVLVLVFCANAVVFGVGGNVLLHEQIADSQALESELTTNLVSTIRATVRPDGLNVPRILGWSSWSFFDDALVVGRQFDVASDGRVVPLGVDLNPIGVETRDPGFDRQTVLVEIERAIRTGETRGIVAGGRVEVIDGPVGLPWGAVWVRLRERIDEGAFVTTLLRWFALSTLALTLATFFAMRRLVLDPVAELARGAERVRGGDLTVRLREPSRRDEIADLVRLFNEMAATVHGFNARLADEVASATEQARRAEAAAMTQRRLAAMGELAAGIAHEINNPLGGLLNAVETLGRPDIDDERRERYMRLLTTGLTRIGETVNRLRRFTPRHATAEPVDLGEVARDAVDLVRHRAERLGVAIEIDGGDEPRVVPGARNDIGQAVLNLFANALDALEEELASTPEGRVGKGAPRIDVTIANEDELGPDEASAHPGVRVTVRDNGPGVGADDLERVQDLFFTTKQVGKGTGLGLSLVNNTIQQHGGWMHVSSAAGEWFAVDLWFPSAPRAGTSDAGEEAEA